MFPGVPRAAIEPDFGKNQESTLRIVVVTAPSVRFDGPHRPAVGWLGVVMRPARLP